jgi:hypothetical protein
VPVPIGVGVIGNLVSRVCTLEGEGEDEDEAFGSAAWGFASF